MEGHYEIVEEAAGVYGWRLVDGAGATRAVSVGEGHPLIRDVFDELHEVRQVVKDADLADVEVPEDDDAPAPTVEALPAASPASGVGQPPDAPPVAPVPPA